MLHALGITHVVSVGECALVPPPVAYAGYTGQAMVKKPGPQWQWIPLAPGMTEFYAKTVQVTCPDGKTPERVYPD